MTIDAARAGLAVAEVELGLAHRATGRDLRGFLHRGRQLADIVLAVGPLAVNYRGLRLPLVGWTSGSARDPAVAAVAAIGLADDLWSGPERGFRGHLRAGPTTGTLKLVGIPLVALLADAQPLRRAARRPRRERPQPARHAPGPRAQGVPRRRGAAAARRSELAVLLAPYDLREMAMLGDAGSNALGAMLGLTSVESAHGKGRWIAIGARSPASPSSESAAPSAR